MKWDSQRNKIYDNYHFNPLFQYITKTVYAQMPSYGMIVWERVYAPNNDLLYHHVELGIMDAYEDRIRLHEVG